MPTPTFAPDLVAARRERVATLRLRGLTQRAIVAALAVEGAKNPETGEAWSLGTIHGDLTALATAWRTEARKATATQRAAELAELREVRRVAWAQGGIEGNAVVAALVTALTDADATVRAGAARSLGSVTVPDLAVILKALQQEADLLGTEAPKVVQGPDGGPLFKVYLGLDPERV